MAKVILSPGIMAIHGKMGNMLYRTWQGEQTVGKVPMAAKLSWILEGVTF